MIVVAILKQIITLTQPQYDIIKNGGAITVNEKNYTYDANTLYLVPENTPDIKYGSTSYWTSLSNYIPAAGEIIIYTDKDVIIDDGQTKNIPGIKIGDGLAYGIDLPFIGDEKADISTLTSLPQTPSSGDLLAVRSGNDTYKIDYNALASAILTNIGDGSFESLNVNTSAGSGSVNIQRYGKMRFLFVQYRPANAGTGQHIAQVDPSDTPAEDICFACTAYAYPGQSELVLQTDGKLILHAYGTPNNTLKGTVAYMVP